MRQRGRNILRRLLEIKRHKEYIAAKRRQLKDVTKKQTIREFHLPKINFEAKNYAELVKIKTQPSKEPFDPPRDLAFPVYTLNYKGKAKSMCMTMPPLCDQFDEKAIDRLVDVPLTAEFENHTQSCERGVASTAGAVKRRRTKDTQLRMALSTVAAREELPSRITVKRFKSDFAKFGINSDC